jgi:hypothetical protein
MAFWADSAAIAAAYDHEDGADGGVQMSFHQNRDNEERTLAVDGFIAMAETEHLRWHVCEMCNNMYESRNMLCRHYMKDHLKPPMLRRIRLFGAEIFIVQF